MVVSSSHAAAGPQDSATVRALCWGEIALLCGKHASSSSVVMTRMLYSTSSRLSSLLDIIYMTYQQNDDTESADRPAQEIGTSNSGGSRWVLSAYQRGSPEILEAI